MKTRFVTEIRSTFCREFLKHSAGKFANSGNPPWFESGRLALR